MPFMDCATQWREFQKGVLDIAAVPGDQVDAAKAAAAKTGDWTARTWPTLATIFLSTNQKSPRLGGDANLPRRQALSYAVDRNAVMAVKADVWAPPAYGRSATGIVPDGIPHADAGGLAYPFDPEKAKALVQRISPLPSLLYLSWGTVPHATHGLSVLDPALLSAGGRQVWTCRAGATEWDTYIHRVSGGRRETSPQRLDSRLPLARRLPLSALPQRQLRGVEPLDVLPRRRSRSLAGGGSSHSRRGEAAGAVRAGREVDSRRRPRRSRSTSAGASA